MTESGAQMLGGAVVVKKSGKCQASEDEEIAASRLFGPSFGPARRFRARLLSRSALQIRR